ncbi:MAG: NshR/TsnR family 23S rRNA methyltransferase [Bifidobacteriaceae bacterium]|jgi:TrmH family RNA methyltransferase|nr:NshR/TsnR family 23S rRNA methyltransferase [Bifidobacteriaceae bacterium]
MVTPAQVGAPGAGRSEAGGSVAGMTIDQSNWPPASPSAVQRLFDLVRHPRQAAKQIVLEDDALIANAITAGVEVAEVYAETGHGLAPSLVAACQAAGVPIRSVAPADAARVFKIDKRARVFAVAKLPSRPARLADIPRDGDIVVLDGVRIAGNIGAIIRSAYALGAAGVILVDSDLPSAWDRRLLRASRGHVFALPTVLATAAEAAAHLADQGVLVAAFDADGAQRIADITAVRGPAALIFGSERRGPSPAFAEAADLRVAIPMRPGAESLNVSVAVGIALQARNSAG